MTAARNDGRRYTKEDKHTLIESALNGYHTGNSIPDICHELALKMGRETTGIASKLQSLGILLNSNLRNKGEKSALTALDGIFIDTASNLYCAGGSSCLKANYVNFNRMRRIVSNADIPSFIWSTLEHFAIRNKQSTVLPFFFKHMREYAQWCELRKKIFEA